VYPGLNGATEGILGATAKKIKQDEDNKVGENYKHYTKLYVRSWDQWDTPLKSHVLAASLRKRVNGRWVVSGGDSGYADVMTGVDAHCPIPPFRGVEDYDVSADGQEIAFSAYLCNESKIAWGTNVDVYRVGVTACQEGVISVGAPKNISAPNPGYDCNPVFSYDGKSIAWFSMQEPGNESDQNRVMIYDRATATATRVADDWTLSPHAMVWTPNNQSLLLTAQEKGRVRVFKCPVTSSSSSSPSPSAAPVAVCGTSAVGGVATLGSNAVVFLQSSMSAPSELYVCRAASAEEGNMAVALTNFNGRRLKKIVRSTAEEFYFKGADDEDVHAWFLKPVGFDEDAKDKWPLACVIHGGPQGAINDSWHYRWNPQTLTAAGFAVVAINFHGSTGYGQAFTDSISKEWGTKPFDDIMKGMDATLEKFAWLDKEKTVALGASYGGFMINWINGHTDRFKALVNHDGVFNQPAMYYTTDELFFCEHEFGGVPWESDLYNKFSPHEFVKNWKTPCLVIHGAKDYRVPLTEGLATFTALQRRGIPSEFLMFPEENHWVLQLDNSIVWHKHVLAWLQRFTN
jgi:dipeptidyl aminopeptidase/acylaminoacyl peptidase